MYASSRFLAWLAAACLAGCSTATPAPAPSTPAAPTPAASAPIPSMPAPSTASASKPADATPVALEPAAPTPPARGPAPAPAERPQTNTARDVRQPFDPARAGLQITAPRGWSTTRRDLALVYAGTLRVPSLVLWEAKAAHFDEAVAGIAAELKPALGTVRITKPASASTVAGYRASVIEGTGRAEGFAMRWRAHVIDAEQVTLMLALTPSFLWGPNRGAVLAFERGVTAREPR